MAIHIPVTTIDTILTTLGLEMEVLSTTSRGQSVLHTNLGAVKQSYRENTNGPRAACFCEQKTEVKLKSFRATMTDRLWRFMQNIRHPWNQDLMAFLCTGEVDMY